MSRGIRMSAAALTWPVSQQFLPGPQTTTGRLRGVNRTSARLAAIAESATLAVDAKAKALKAAGEPVIGFGAGEPDFPTPEPIVEAAVAACREVVNHRYSPTPGLPELRAAIAAKTQRDSAYTVDASQVQIGRAHV